MPNNTTPALLRVWYGNTTTPPQTRVEGSMYVTTGHGSGKAQLHFDLGGSRYTIKSGGQLDYSFTVGNVTFNNTEDKSIDIYTYAFGEGGSNGTFRVTPSLNGTAQTAFDVAIKGLGTAAYTDAGAYLAANGTATAANRLTVGLSIYNNSSTAVIFGSDGQDKSVYIGSDLVVGNGTATSMTSAALTNGAVHLIPLYQTGENTWSAKRRIPISGAGGVSVTASNTGAITITGTTYTALPNPYSIEFNNGGSGASSGSTYNGNADLTVSYNTIGAASNASVITGASFDSTDNKTLKLARANGSLGDITVALPTTAAINISGKADTAGTADQLGHGLELQINGTQKAVFNGQSDATFNVTYAQLGEIPLEYIPASARERLFVTALTSTNNTDAKAIGAAITNNDVQAGDVVQVNPGTGVTPGVEGDGSGKMYFIYDNNGTLTYKAFTAGTTAYATLAKQLEHGFSITAKNAKSDNTDLTASFNGLADSSITIPLATGTYAGLLSAAAQTIGGDKTFTGAISGTSATFSNGVVATGGFTGNLSGKATTAGTADQTQCSIEFTGTAFNLDNTNSITFNGAADKTIGTFTPATAAAAGHWGMVPTPPANSHQKFMTGGATWWTLAGERGIEAIYDDSTNTVKIRHNKDNITRRNNLVDATLGTLSGDTDVSIFGANDTTFTIGQVFYDIQGHITSVTNSGLTIKKVTYTPATAFASEGYTFGTFSDGTNDIVIRGGVVWETFS